MQYYHGSSAEPFDKFSLEHAGEGDGKAKYGYGVYVTSAYGSAAHYAYNKHRKENKNFYVYTVEIPDKTEDNCLSLLKQVPVSESIVRRVEERLGERIPEEVLVEGIPFRKWLANRVIGNQGPVNKMKDRASFEAEKAASEFLLGIGVELIEWPYLWRYPDRGRNMAVLDERNVHIIRIEKVELDPKGHQLIEGSQRVIKEF